ncbi:MAG: hypothetical protein GXO32_08140 [Crenarchaeota archaeon]|nr:hypothetical protein [Thermoproteota archaeon]
MNRYLTIALIGIGLLVLALVLSFAAMSGSSAVHRTYEQTYSVAPNHSSTLDIWAITGAFSKNITLFVKTDCRPLNLEIVEKIGRGRVVKEVRVYNETVIRGLERFVAPRIVIGANESCTAALTLSFYYVQTKYAWLSLPALLFMVVGAALLLVGGSAYTAYKIRFAKSRTSK